jgi:hypothetical protein
VGDYLMLGGISVRARLCDALAWLRSVRFVSPEDEAERERLERDIAAEIGGRP